MKSIITLVILLLSVCSYSQFGNEQNLLKTTMTPLNFVNYDLDGDGDQDIVCSSKDDQQIAVYENLGNNLYNAQIVVSSSIQEARSIDVEDIDGDGDGDIVVTAFFGNEISWFENLGNMEFGGQISISNTLTNVSFVHVEDINNDGDNDIVAAVYTDDKIVWFENLGGGTFSTENLISGATNGATSVCVKDLDGDGDPDIVSTSYNDDKVAWYENLGGGTFSAENIITTTSNGAQFVTSYDFDNDNDNDLLVSSKLDQKVTLYTNNGSGVFNLNQVLASTAWDCNYVSFADYDNDGDMDISVPGVNLSSSLRTVIYENISGNFSTSHIIADYSQYAILSVDVDNNGLVDLMYTDNFERKIAWRKNLGGLNFSEELVLSTDYQDNNLMGHAVDMDNDGDNDLVFYKTSKMKWYENLGGGNFGATQRLIADPLQTSGTYNNMRDFLPADIDNDGDIDFFGAHYAATPAGFGWFENLGNQNFAEYVSLATDLTVCTELGYEDIDNDGIKDIVIGTFNTSGDLAWYKNLGGGNFGPKNMISTGEVDAITAIYLADLNNDGNMDVVTASALDDKIAWFENNGGGSFSSQQIISTNADNANDVFVADFDNDGFKDVVSASRNDYKIAWYKNLGNNTFSSEIIVEIFTDDAYFVSGADLNNDGDMDIIATFPISYPGTIRWYENQGNGTFGTGEDIDVGTFSEYSPEHLVIADFDGDNDEDVASFCAGPNTAARIVIASNFNVSEIQVSGQVYVDLNQNQQFDSTDYYASQISINSTPQSAYAYTYIDGNYFMNFKDTIGTYIISAGIPNYWTVSTDSLVYNVSIDTSFTNRDSLDFGLIPDTIINVLTSDLTGGFPRCNTEVNYWISIDNEGTTVPTGVVHLTLDDSLTYVSSAVTPDSIQGQHIYWTYDSLAYFSTEMIGLLVLMPDFQSINDTVLSFLEVTVDSIPGSQYSSVDTLWQIIQCAYDPNIKTAIPTGVTDSSYISPSTSTIEYMIEFQNTGNDTAITVIITDQLMDHIDLSSFHPVSSSDPYLVQVSTDGLITFTFQNIMLPDSNVNEPASHGFVKYNVDLLPGLVHGDVIENTANIYFDFNPAIVTPTKYHRVFNCAFYPMNSVTYNYPLLMAVDQAETYQWIDCTNGSLEIPGATNQDYEPLVNGEYAVVSSNLLCSTTSDCYEVFGLDIQSLDNSHISVYPNPANDVLYIQSAEIVESLQILDLNGKLLITRGSIANSQGIQLDISQLPQGVYILNVTTESQQYNQLIVVQ